MIYCIFVIFLFFYGTQLVSQFFYLDDRHFQVKIILKYIFYADLYVESVNKLSIYLLVLTSSRSPGTPPPHTHTHTHTHPAMRDSHMAATVLHAESGGQLINAV